ncbi:CopG family transcriptional regulator [Agrobacterium tumefaciens]|uniref:type II toxin-antitoxin system BrnA family antitoxin n=1 Tax=Agrobacterium tumefaciens TaxID=358 RepID=UPI001ADD33D4|nr:CopG family antitoxin [Agrobacterium tumefaciens]QTK80844.1 CopG family transcriptional regulator [Agrobacterium tumefaciens]
MKTISAEDFDKKFDDGEDLDGYIDWSKARRPGLEMVHVDIDLPEKVLRRVDAEAARLGVTRQSLMANWIAERLEIGRGGK